MNRRAVKRGRQGEGQWSVREDKTILLGSNERRQIRRRQLKNLIESATQDIGATANLYSEASASRIANPTELFSTLYFSARGEGVSEKILRGLEKQTRDWLKDWSPVDAQKIDSVSLGRTRYAYDARRQLRAASEYEFALRTPPDRPISLRVTEWEQALRYPAIIWMKVFLGVEADDEDGNAWAIATGQWVHRWLASGVGNSETNEFRSDSRSGRNPRAHSEKRAPISRPSPSALRRLRATAAGLVELRLEQRALHRRLPRRKTIRFVRLVAHGLGVEARFANRDSNFA